MSRRSSDGLKDVIRDYRRDQIIDVARRLFGERGSTNIPMDEIASEAGVARSTVYVYFASRDDLLRACLHRMYLLLQDDLAGAWERDAGPSERLRAVVHGLMARVDESPTFFTLALGTQVTAGRDGEALGAELSHIGLDMARILEDLVEQGVATGEFRPIGPSRAAALIGQLVFGTMWVRASDPAPSPLDDDVEGVCDFVLRSLRQGVPAATTVRHE